MAFHSPNSDFLFPYCKEGNWEGVRELLALNASVEQVDGHGRTALYHACRQGHMECAQLLIEAGGSINQSTHKGNTPLLAACHHGHTPCAELLLETGAQADHADNDGYTPLLISSRQGFYDCAKLLLEKQASVDRAMNGGFTPLFAACNQGHARCVSLLLDARATVDKATAHGTTPMLTATQLGHLNCVRLLSMHGARRTAPAHGNLEQNASTRGHQHVADWLANSCEWSTPLHHLDVFDALELDRTTGVDCRIVPAGRARQLLREGADLHACVQRPPPPHGDGTCGVTPLQVAQQLLPHGGVAPTNGTKAAASAAQLVLWAAQPWSPETHEFFPGHAKGHAVRCRRPRAPAPHP